MSRPPPPTQPHSPTTTNPTLFFPSSHSLPSPTNSPNPRIFLPIPIHLTPTRKHTLEQPISASHFNHADLARHNRPSSLSHMQPLKHINQPSLISHDLAPIVGGDRPLFTWIGMLEHSLCPRYFLDRMLERGSRGRKQLVRQQYLCRDKLFGHRHCRSQNERAREQRSSR